MSRRAAVELARAASSAAARPTLRHAAPLAALATAAGPVSGTPHWLLHLQRSFVAAVVPPSRSGDARPLPPRVWAASPLTDEDRAVATPPPSPPPPPTTTTWADAGWTAASTLTAANAVSAARLAAAPAAYTLISHAHWTPALALVAAAGISDWADGALARRGGGEGVSVLGTYLDPLADKAFACAAVAGCSAAGILPAWLAGAVVVRDAGLVVGAVAARWVSVGRRWPGGPDFFRLVASEEGLKACDGVPAGGGGGGASERQPLPSPPLTTTTSPAPAVRPLFISKLNTALQFVTLAAALASPGLGWPDAGVVEGLAAATVATTGVSAVAYGAQWVTGGGVRKGVK